MGSLPGWMPLMLDRINWGCSVSPWFIELAEESKVLKRANRILSDLWPFIFELPLNIQAVKRILPERMQAANQLLAKLCDDERYYQELFKQQFLLAGSSMEEINSRPPNPATVKLCRSMTQICRTRTYADGIYAIVAAELAATMYCRASLPLYEHFFNERNKYEPDLINSGLEWLRLHAKTHTRHAIWMKRMLSELDDHAGNEIPDSAETILQAVLDLWECPSEVLAVGAGL